MKVINRRVRHDYHLLEKIEAGIELSGAEVKSVKAGRIKMGGSFVKIKDHQAWLFNAHIAPYQSGNQPEYDSGRARRLLLHKKEIVALQTKMKQKRLTLVPVSCYTKGPWIKISLSLAKGKKRHEKRQAKKQKDIEREMERELRG